MLSRDVEMSLAAAFREAEVRRHEFVSLEHLLFALLHNDEATAIVTACGGDVVELKRSLESYFSNHLEHVPGEGPYELELTTSLQRLLDRVVNHVKSSEKKEATPGDVLASLMLEEDSYATFYLKKQGLSRLELLEYISHGANPDADADSEGDRDDRGARNKRQPRFLDRFTENLNARADDGAIDPLIGRTIEVERVLQILGRRTKNNPIFVGDAGVGKTAIVHGLARNIVSGEVPAAFRGTTIYALDMSALLAGTKFRGDFEARLKGVIAELKATRDSILFIDEIHTIVGAGATSGGSMDASNILKPLLSTGTLRCIGSTTFEEYKRHFEKDHALSRRFQKVIVEEPTTEETIKILTGLAPAYEAFHHVRYSRTALKAAVDLAVLHMHDRRLPDKAIDVIDEAGSNWKIAAGDAFPRAPSEATDATGEADEPRSTQVTALLEADEAVQAEPEAPQPKQKTITVRDIETVVARMTKRPVATVSAREKLEVQALEQALSRRVFGQEDAVHRIVSAIKRNRAGLAEPNKPIGSFLMVGPTGVGKTETARQLAELLGVGLIRFDMSEYMEKHTVSRLIGAPPGYVGYDDGGLLTDAVIQSPYAVVLLDEVEKAHPDVFDLLLQIMDYATLTDSNGRRADFHHCVLLMTSNVGAREMTEGSIGFDEEGESPLDLAEGEKAVKRLFRPEFTNRLDSIISFLPLSEDDVLRIVDKFAGELNERLAKRRVTLTLTEAARKLLAEEGYDPTNGARPLKRVFQRLIADPLTDLMFGALSGGGTVSVSLIDGDGPVVAGSEGETLEHEGLRFLTVPRRRRS